MSFFNSITPIKQNTLFQTSKWWWYIIDETFVSNHSKVQRSRPIIAATVALNVRGTIFRRIAE